MEIREHVVQRFYDGIRNSTQQALMLTRVTIQNLQDSHTFQSADWPAPAAYIPPKQPAIVSSATFTPAAAVLSSSPSPLTASPSTAAAAAAAASPQPGRRRRNASRTVHRWGLAQWPPDGEAWARRQRQNREAQSRFRAKSRRLRDASPDAPPGGAAAGAPAAGGGPGPTYAQIMRAALLPQ